MENDPVNNENKDEVVGPREHNHIDDLWLYLFVAIGFFICIVCTVSIVWIRKIRMKAIKMTRICTKE